MQLRLGSRIFAPRIGTTLLALALIAALVALGRWQLNRAGEKQVLYEEFAKGTEATQPLDAASAALRRYQHVRASGKYDSSRQILIDNMTDDRGRAGYYVITPFEMNDGRWLLINRGWVPVGASRRARPNIDVAQNARDVQGRIDHLPRTGLHLGEPSKLAPPFPVVANFPTRADIAALLNGPALTPAAEVLLLDPGEPDGYLRQWHPPGFPPVRHLAYAVQWFGLALTLAVIWAVTNLKRAPGTPS